MATKKLPTRQNQADDLDDTTVDVTPAKRFFVEMLTRDIELEDAILDLLDNCVDGAVRVNATNRRMPNPAKTYDGFWAKIDFDAERFTITDNCGGIPPDVARDYAFRFGRPRANIDANLQTVGVYGIGMKRALFKLGQDCRVTSHSENGSFEIHIDKNWIQSDEWFVHLNRVNGNPPPEYGVRVSVSDLHSGIAHLFDPSASSFEEGLISKIRDHYAYIIQKGFEVKVNGTRVSPSIIQTLFDSESSNSNTIAPYVYTTVHDGVTVQITMGMYAPFPSETELDDFSEGRRSKNSAGWTVICNDRVVLSHDTTHRTGWGEAGVPTYHSQFVALAGIVEFTSNDPAKLPVTTTKRGINLDSDLYASVKDVMRDALKHFTTFTNHWKSDSNERAALQKTARAFDIRAVAAHIPESRWQEVRKNLKGRRFVPDLPKPVAVRTHGRITFERPLDAIERVRNFLELPEDGPRADVGAAAFDWVAEQAKS